MFTYNHHFYLLLKDLVLSKAGIKYLIPSECQHLSSLIFTETRKRVSETTIKRIYGFAVSKFNPSPFTLQTLSEYCGYGGWEEFCNQEEPENKQPAEVISWQTLYKRASRITQFTLQSLKKRSGIPYDLTVDRKFIHEYFDDFLQSEKQIALLAAPGGYGKTISLCHLVDDLLKQNENETTSQNLVMLFSSNTITNVSPNELNLGNWLMTFLGMQETGLLDFFEKHENNVASLYLIIDGFEEHMFKPDQYLLFFNQLIDISVNYSKYSWFKIILTMRSATWLNYRYLIEEKPLLRDRWYTGFMQDENKTVNFLPFSADEMLELTRRLNPALKTINLPEPEYIKKLANPFLFQLFYQNNSKQFSIENADMICLYQMISSYALHRIYHGANSMEKILLLKNMIEMIDFKSGQLSVPKIKLYELIKSYPTTYRELILQDVIREENFSKYLQYDEQVSFTNNTLLEYCLARKLYSWNGEKLDQKLLLELEELLDNSPQKLPVIRWIIFFIISKNSNEQLVILKDFSLLPVEQLDIIIFTCQMLQKQLRETPDRKLLKTYFNKVEQNETFGFLLSLQYITPEYEKALLTLLNFDLNTRNRILVFTTLAIINMLNLNSDKAEYYIREVGAAQNIEHENFIISPYNCLDTLFSYFKYGIIKKEALQEITHLYHNDFKIRRMTPAEYNSNEIVLKLALLTLKISNNPFKELRFIRMVKKYTDINRSKYTTPISIFFLSMSSASYLRAGNKRKAIKIQNELLRIQHAHQSVFTPFMKILFSILSIRSSAQNEAGKVALLNVRSLMAYSGKKGFKLAEAYAGFSYLSSPQLREAAPEDLAEIYGNTLRLIRTSGFRLESFLNPELQVEIENLLHQKQKNSATILQNKTDG